MVDVRHDVIAAPGVPELAYSQAGAGPDVILLHGALVTREDMILALLPSLAERFRVTAFDRPGHGGSGRLGPTGSPWRQAEAIHAACQALGVERPVIVGHSYGGAAALAFALQFPGDVAGVVALAPISFPEVRLEHLVFGPRGLPLLGPAFALAASTGLDPLMLPILWRAMFLPQEMPLRFAELFPFETAGRTAQTEAEGEDALLLNAGLTRSAMNYARCQVPVRIFGGEGDLVVNNALHGKLLARVLPDGEFERLAGLGHMLHHFAQPRIVEAVCALTS